ncbi:MAG: hypothetical protein MUO40_03480 [Anaerolineaceae bacterium]|nr:hypothetical protein [Anaerolineaceae bacterium]
MNKKLTLLVLILLLSACSKSGKETTQVPPVPETPSTQIITLAREKLSADESVSIDQIVMEKIEEVTFPDSCLGIVSDGLNCTTVLTPGYKIFLTMGGKQFIYHSNMEGTQILIASSETNDSDSLNLKIPIAVNAARQFLANELLLKPLSIKIVSYEFRSWPDGCLGISEAGKMCIQVITPGYSVTLDYKGQIYRLRTDQSGNLIKIDTTKPQPGVQDS